MKTPGSGDMRIQKNLPNIQQLHCFGLSVRAGDAASDREKVALSREGDAQVSILKSFLKLTGDDVGEASLLYLETCHRIEIYSWNLDQYQLIQAWLHQRGLNYESKRVLKGVDAFEHLVRVTSSMDSEVLGETQITGQVKTSAQFCRDHLLLKGNLDRILQQAFRISKKIRSLTSLSQGTVSVAHSAIDGLSDIFDSLKGKSALLIGAGAMAMQALERLRNSGVSQLTWSNRSLDKIQALAVNHRCLIAPFEERHTLAWSHDVIVVATASHQPIMLKKKLENAQANAPEKFPDLRVILDLGLPRNVEPEVAQIDGFFLRNVDEFKDRAEKGNQLRRQALDSAELILKEELEAFIKTLENWGKAPLIGQLYQQFELFRTELCQEQIGLEKSEEFEYILRGTFAKILHRLVEELDQLDESHSQAVMETLIRAWRPSPEWQLKNQDLDRQKEPQELLPKEKSAIKLKR